MRASPWTIRVIGLFLVVVVLLLCGWRFTTSGPADPHVMLQEAKSLASQGDFEAAENLARRALSIDSDLPVGSCLIAEFAMQRKDYDQALKELSNISLKHKEDWLAAQYMKAEILHHHLYRLGDAEQCYRQIISHEPENVFAHDGLARLLGLCGRRREAVPHILSLIRSGQDTDLLILLSREGGHVNDPEALAAAQKADPEDPNPLVGMAYAAHANQEYSKALRLLKKAQPLTGLPADFHGRVGQQLLNLEEYDLLLDWVQTTTSPLSVESWNVLAKLADRQQNLPAAIRCYWEILKVSPTSIHAMNQLAQKLNAVDERETAKVFSKRFQELNRLRDLQQMTIMSSETPRFADVWELIRAYVNVGRHWEAIAWGKLALEAQPQNTEMRQLMRSLYRRMSKWPLEQTLPEFNPALDIDLSHFKLPQSWERSTVTTMSGQTSDIRFVQNAAEIGFDFSYFDGSEGTTKRMFEFAGGGIACLDYDCDGGPDLFCTQGRLWEKQDNIHVDVLFRNIDGKQFVNCSEKAGIIESGFGQGVSSGDLNNDGFPDIYVANAQDNQIWINNGDGTFTPKSLESVSEWTTSCLIADINGDSFADLYDVNYLTGDDIFSRTCQHEDGGKIMCTPYDFEGATDCLWLSNGQGGYEEKTSEILAQSPLGKGLGILAWKPSLDHVNQKGLSLFVSNDTVANFHYTPNESGTWSDTALSSGLAYNGDGKAEACMGIASGDCDEDGKLDLHVTNYLYESNTLYRNVSGTLFEDKTRAYQLHKKSLPVLGFGTQFLDANLDGHLELFVVNGHTEDLSKYGTPFQMLPQYFEWTGKQFQELQSEQLGSWYDNRYVGRALARWDWNLDHKPDLVIGLLNRPSFILTNQSPIENWLEVRLVGTVSSRDATGSTVLVKCGDRFIVHQLTAGDGYQCSNQKAIMIGLGQSTEIDKLTVYWSSNSQSQLEKVRLNQRIVIVEGFANSLEINP